MDESDFRWFNGSGLGYWLNAFSSPLPMDIDHALISLSFWMMVSASRILPVGTVYAVFVGIGTLGTVIVGMLFFNESVSFIKLCFILTLLIGVIGLKLTTDQAGEQQ